MDEKNKWDKWEWEAWYTGFSIKLDERRLKQIEDVSNSNIKVRVMLDDGVPLRIVVGTPKNLQYLMEKNKVNFYDLGLPWIIVPKLTKEIIYEAIKAYLYNNRGFSIELDERRLKQIEDVSNSIIEVGVRLQDKFTLRIAVGTPDVMENKMELYSSGLPWIIVPKLTKEIIYEAIKDYFDANPERYWLKFHPFKLDIDRDDQDDYDY